MNEHSRTCYLDCITCKDIQIFCYATLATDTSHTYSTNAVIIKLGKFRELTKAADEKYKLQAANALLEIAQHNSKNLIGLDAAKELITFSVEYKAQAINALLAIIRDGDTNNKIWAITKLIELSQEYNHQMANILLEIAQDTTVSGPRRLDAVNRLIELDEKYKTQTAVALLRITQDTTVDAYYRLEAANRLIWLNAQWDSQPESAFLSIAQDNTANTTYRLRAAETLIKVDQKYEVEMIKVLLKIAQNYGARDGKRLDTPEALFDEMTMKAADAMAALRKEGVSASRLESAANARYGLNAVKKLLDFSQEYKPLAANVWLTTTQNELIDPDLRIEAAEELIKIGEYTQQAESALLDVKNCLKSRRYTKLTI